MKILVTGGAGFIGSALVRYLIQNTHHRVVNIDKLTYAGNLESLDAIASSTNYVFEQSDICQHDTMKRLFRYHRPDAVIHLAAESHVDRSIDGPEAFIKTNILGTYSLLEAAHQYWMELDAERKRSFRFLHVSTDEVFGDLGMKAPPCSELARYAPSSPYSASKSSSDHLVWAWWRSYGLPVLITHCSNNYGPYQFPEKLIPLIILNALEGKPLPIYGTGHQVRDWLYVEDHVSALLTVLAGGKPGESYNIGGHNQKTNLEVVETLCELLEEIIPARSTGVAVYRDLITQVSDRPGHDERYAINTSKVQQELNWQPQESFSSGIRKTVDWYLQNPEWCWHVQNGSYQRQRLGTAHQEVS